MAKLENVTELLRGLKLHEAADQLNILAADAAMDNMTPMDMIEKLMSSEVASRNEKGRIKRFKAANFPFEGGFEGFDFSNKELGITKGQMKQLMELTWIEQAYNIMFLGPSGLGKARLSITLGMKAVDEGYNVYFVTLEELMKIIETAEISTKSGHRLKQIRNCDLLILDEVGFLPISKQEANYLFDLVNKLYMQTSIILTSNKEFEEWSDFLGDSTITAAILDRLAHQCEIFTMNGPSWRIEHRKTILDKEHENYSKD